MTLRYGSIRYVNNLPVDHALTAGHVDRPRGLDILSGTPTQLNAAFSAGRVDVSAVSAASLLDGHDTVLLPEAAIASHAEVDSVLLMSAVPLDQLDGATIAVTSESATGALLLRILMERERGIRAHYRISEEPLERLADDADAALVIGDRALTTDRSALHLHTVLDLGEAWRAYSGLPMVYAVWAARAETAVRHPDALADLRGALTASQAWGRENHDRILAIAHERTGVPTATLDRYYHRLAYRLGAREQAGLERFLAEAAALGGAPSVGVTILPALEAPA